MTFVIPYRDRASHLNQFLKHYRRLFPDAYFLVVEQSWSKLFNRAMLFNVGILEHPSDYYIFHDVDMLVQGLPDYSKPINPTHLATHASQFGNKMPFEDYFGGVVLMTDDHVKKVNGWSNRFWGWSSEDNEMQMHIERMGLKIDRREHYYFSLPHPRSHPTGFDSVKMEEAKIVRPYWDGLSATKYTAINTIEFNQGRKITVEL